MEKTGNKNKVILNLIQDLQRGSGVLRDSVRGRFQIKFGMTPLLNNGGFTLIELLVVVLIIGILAAIALPQYQKAVEKARAAEAVVRISQLEKAIDLWKLTNPGEDCHCFFEGCEPKCSPLDIDFHCDRINGGSGECFTRDFDYQITPGAIYVYPNGRHYYAILVNLNTKERFCGWFDSISRAVCDGLAANGGWESLENQDF